MSGSRSWTGPSSQAWRLTAQRGGQGRLAGAHPPSWSWPSGTPGCLEKASCKKSWRSAPKNPDTFSSGPPSGGSARGAKRNSWTNSSQPILWAHFLLLLLLLPLPVWKAGPLPLYSLKHLSHGCAKRCLPGTVLSFPSVSEEGSGWTCRRQEGRAEKGSLVALPPSFSLVARGLR